MASPTVRNKATISGASGTTFAPSKPTGTTAGDVLLAIYYLEATGAVTMPTGFTNAVDVTNTSSSPNSRMRIDWKIADGSEGATLSWSWTGSQWRMGVLWAVQGAQSSGTPVEQGNSANNGNVGAGAAPNVALAGNVSVDALVFLGSFISTVSANNWTAPATWTLEQNFAADDSGYGSIAQAAGGAPATTHMVLGTTPPNGNVGSVIIAVKSPAAVVEPFPAGYLRGKQILEPILRM